jgi:hypothetical protein
MGNKKEIIWMAVCQEHGLLDKMPNGALIEATAKAHKTGLYGGNKDCKVIVGYEINGGDYKPTDHKSEIIDALSKRSKCLDALLEYGKEGGDLESHTLKMKASECDFIRDCIVEHKLNYLYGGY